MSVVFRYTRKIRAGHEALRNGEWRDDLYRADTTGRELCEMTVGIIGYGTIGQLVTQLLRGFGCRIVVLSARPGRVSHVEDVKLARPRTSEIRLSEDLLAIKRRLWDMLEH